MQELATFAGAGVPPGLAGLRSADEADGLGADILQLKRAFLKHRVTEQILAAVVFQNVTERSRAERPTIADFRCNRLSFMRPSAQP